MITGSQLIYKNKADVQQDCSFGNILFRIAGTIGIAEKNGYEYGFKKWINQEYFKHPLPITEREFKKWKMPATYKGYDFGFNGFDVPDNIQLDGELASGEYFKHCEDKIRYYFEMKELCDPLDCILMHFRDYGNNTGFAKLDSAYYTNALKHFPKKKVVVITDNIGVAKNTLKMNVGYTSNSPIIDFYLLSHAKYLVMANSTFSWWGAWLSKAKTVAPLNWYAGEFKDAPMKDFYLPNWILV